MTAIIDLDAIELAEGAHPSWEDGACLLEAVSYVAGEPWTDHPECVCPVLAAFGRAWNDALPDDKRTELLRPFIPKLIGTRSTVDVQDARAFMATDWAVRTYTPVWLRAVGLEEEATELEALPELSSVELCRAAMPIIDNAKKRAYAAWAAAGVAAGVAVGAAVGDAAGAAAGAAARAAARDAARVALRPHVALLPTSAVDLYHRMIDVTA
jgi:hypothetical protein